MSAPVTPRQNETSMTYSMLSYWVFFAFIMLIISIFLRPTFTSFKVCVSEELAGRLAIERVIVWFMLAMLFISSVSNFLFRPRDLSNLCALAAVISLAISVVALHLACDELSEGRADKAVSATKPLAGLFLLMPIFIPVAGLSHVAIADIVLFLFYAFVVDGVICIKAVLDDHSLDGASRLKGILVAILVAPISLFRNLIAVYRTTPISELLRISVK